MWNEFFIRLLIVFWAFLFFMAGAFTNDQINMRAEVANVEETVSLQDYNELRAGTERLLNISEHLLSELE